VNKNIIRRVLTTEKGTRLQEAANQYAFEVAREANKMEIRTAVEQQFGVKVKDVNTMNRRGKAKRLRTQKYGKTSDWKRAVVTLQAGQKIELA
jgi:large subunit ribosomal protein L23